jgi:hypothetical protein
MIKKEKDFVETERTKETVERISGFANIFCKYLIVQII